MVVAGHLGFLLVLLLLFFLSTECMSLGKQRNREQEQEQEQEQGERRLEWQTGLESVHSSARENGIAMVTSSPPVGWLRKVKRWRAP